MTARKNGCLIALATLLVALAIGCGDKVEVEKAHLEQLARPVNKMFEFPAEVIRAPEAIEGTSLARVHIKRGKRQIVSALVSKELASTLKVGDQVEEQCIAFMMTYMGGDTFVCTIKVS